MKKLFNSGLFLLYIFILFFIIINIYLIFQINIYNLFDSYITIYSFWFFIILLLKFISTQINFKEDNHV